MPILAVQEFEEEPKICDAVKMLRCNEHWNTGKRWEHWNSTGTLGELEARNGYLALSSSPCNITLHK